MVIVNYFFSIFIVGKTRGKPDIENHQMCNRHVQFYSWLYPISSTFLFSYFHLTNVSTKAEYFKSHVGIEGFNTPSSSSFLFWELCSSIFCILNLWLTESTTIREPSFVNWFCWFPNTQNVSVPEIPHLLGFFLFSLISSIPFGDMSSITSLPLCL